MHKTAIINILSSFIFCAELYGDWVIPVELQNSLLLTNVIYDFYNKY